MSYNTLPNFNMIMTEQAMPMNGIGMSIPGMTMPTSIDMSFLNRPWTTNSYGYGVSSGTASSSNNSDDIYERWKKKTEEEAQKNYVDTTFLKEKNEEIVKTRDLINAQSKMIEDIKNSKKSDGKTIIETYKLKEPEFDENGKIKKNKKAKKGFWGKTASWLSSAGSAIANMGKSFIGYDENGKWKLSNFIANAIPTAVAIGACFIPVVGPVIGYGLLAYGVASGGYGVYKGIKKLDKARTAEEEEKARQEICSGAIVGAASVAGLRGIGKAFSSSSSASTATATSFGGKITQGVSNFAKDMTINAVKGTAQAMRADQALIAAKGGGFSGFTKAYGAKVSQAWGGFNSWENRYDAQYKKMETSLNNKISELNTQITAETNAAKRTLLQEQKAMLENNLTELRSMSTIKTKTEFDKMRTKNSANNNQERLSSYTESSRGYEINGQQISQQRFNAFKSETQSIQKQYNKDLKKLIDAKECKMRQYASKPDAHRTELNEYTQSNIRAKYNTPEKLKTGMETLRGKIADCETKIADLENKIASTSNRGRIKRLRKTLNNTKTAKAAAESELSVCSSIKFPSKFKTSTWCKNEYQLFIGGKNPGKMIETAKIAGSHPATIVPLSMSQWNRGFSVPMFGTDLVELTPEQTTEYISQLEQQKAELEKSLEMLDEIKDATQWNQLKALRAQQAEQAQKEAEAQQQSEEQQAAKEETPQS